MGLVLALVAFGQPSRLSGSFDSWYDDFSEQTVSTEQTGNTEGESQNEEHQQMRNLYHLALVEFNLSSSAASFPGTAVPQDVFYELSRRITPNPVAGLEGGAFTESVSKPRHTNVRQDVVRGPFIDPATIPLENGIAIGAP